jgi:hypothetical protein
MSPDQANALRAQLTLPPGFTAAVAVTEDGSASVDILGPNEWICAFSLPVQLAWAQDQITAASS